MVKLQDDGRPLWKITITKIVRYMTIAVVTIVTGIQLNSYYDRNYKNIITIFRLSDLAAHWLVNEIINKITLKPVRDVKLFLR